MAARQSTEMYLKKQDLTNWRCGRLTVVSFSHQRRLYNGRYLTHYWKCVCDCGKEVVVNAKGLTSGGSQSCGCRRSEWQRRRGGLSESEVYDTYNTMMSRCYNEKNKAYHNYGGRGISVCDRWRYGEEGKDGLQCFIEDVSPRPSPELTLDRVDNMSGYRPDNVRWATPKEQSYNRRNNIYIEHAGKRVLLKELAHKSGVSYRTVHDRWRRGETGDALIAKPEKHSVVLLTVGGVTKTVTEWAKIKGVPRISLAYRIKAGWPEEDLFRTPDRSAQKHMKT